MSDLFNILGHALAPLDTMAQRDKPLQNPSAPGPTPVEPDLRWCKFPLNERGWCLHLGYTTSGDPFDDGDVDLRRIVLNTGYRNVKMWHPDLDNETWLAALEHCREDWQKSYEVQP